MVMVICGTNAAVSDPERWCYHYLQSRLMMDLIGEERALMLFIVRSVQSHLIEIAQNLRGKLYKFEVVFLRV